MGPLPDIVCATWNVHRAVGSDRRPDGARVLDAIAADIAPERPRVFALQEADADDPPHAALLDVARLEAATGLVSVHDGPDMRWSAEGGGFLGNLLLLDPAIEILRRRIVDLPGAVPRAAVLAETMTDGVPLRLVSCHLSLVQALRAVQMRTLGQVIARAPAMQTILLGDLNEWRPWGGLALGRRASGLALAGPARRTFPSRAPMLPLDRILTDRGGTVRGARALRGAAVAAASDHLPLRARVTRGDAA
ncbi:endonuclease/exonuclease/phosphatase family protein [Jannaschia marina]|uniref:endonuclease/exonuclease/phosphatase family protein n=1 Tax=Jannaschia marina TaxID=2741674 RepID=UPI0015C9900F|nr:endonuclease/exonuclease/phosphatase family protein [Jannaschia marina]